MDTVLLYSFLSVLLVSVMSLVGIFAFLVREDILRKALIFLVSFSAGALLGDAFIHLLPEAVEKEGFGLSISLYIIASIITFFILEKFFCWRHCHTPTSESHPHSLGMMNLVGDSLHNLIDGVIIAGSYFVSIPLGMQTTIAVVTHEIPQEMGDFGVLLYAGFAKRKALLFNFLSALFSFGGMGIFLYFEKAIEGFTLLVVPFAAGGFIYVACSDLIPELHKETNPKKSLVQLAGFCGGVTLMIVLMALG